MSEETLTTSHLTGAETTMEMTQITSEYNIISHSLLLVFFSGSHGSHRIHWNGCQRTHPLWPGGFKQHKKQVLIFNQNALDLFSSIFLVISTFAVAASPARPMATGFARY